MALALAAPRKPSTLETPNTAELPTEGSAPFTSMQKVAVGGGKFVLAGRPLSCQ